MSSLLENMKAILPALVLVLLLASAWAALPELYENGEALEDENVVAEPEPVEYPVEYIYLIVFVALILAGVTYYLYTTPSEVEIKEMKERKKALEKLKKKKAKKPKKKKKK